jgi:hypothetical protein
MTHEVEDEPPTTAELYGRAVTSSHLRTTLFRSGAIDYVIAAGLLKHGLGTTLYRLRGEYDALRGEIILAEANTPSWEARAVELERRAKRWRPPEQPSDVELIEEAVCIRAEGRSYALTSRAMVLLNLKSLTEAREALWRYSYSLLAPKGRFMLDDSTAASVTGRVLDAWLDPSCHHCQGRGFNGGAHRGEQRVFCRPCRGSGNRRSWIGKGVEEREFAVVLLLRLDEYLRTVDRTIRRWLREHPAIGA